MRTTLFLSALLLLASACRDTELSPGTPFSRTSATATTEAMVPTTAGPEAPLPAPSEVPTVADPWEAPQAEPAPATSSRPSTSSQGPVWIETTCEDASFESQLAQIKQDNASARDVEIGRAGVIIDKGNRQQLTAWDTDSNCHVDVTAPMDVDTVAIARAVLSQLPGRG